MRVNYLYLLEIFLSGRYEIKVYKISRVLSLFSVTSLNFQNSYIVTYTCKRKVLSFILFSTHFIIFQGIGTVLRETRMNKTCSSALRYSWSHGKPHRWLSSSVIATFLIGVWLEYGCTYRNELLFFLRNWRGKYLKNV